MPWREEHESGDVAVSRIFDIHSSTEQNLGYAFGNRKKRVQPPHRDFTRAT